MSQLSFETLSEFLRKFGEAQCAEEKNDQCGGLSASDLAKFLTSFETLIRKDRKEERSGLSVADLAGFLASFSPLWQEDRKVGRNLNIFDVFGLGHDEKAHCAFLAWLLNPGASHGHGGLFFQACFAHLLNCERDESVRAGDYTVRTELCPLGDMTDRVDIVCDGRDFLCYIEAKIDAVEHGGQTVRYQEKLALCANGRRTALIFLAAESQPACPSAIPLSWRDLAASLDTMRERYSDELSPFLRELVRQYAAFIRGFHGK